MRFLRNKKAQSVVEFAVLLVIVMGAFLAASYYMKRGLQGRWKAAVDDLGDQYDPRVASSDVTSRLIQNTVTDILVYNTVDGFYSTRADETISIETKTGSIIVGAY